MQNFITLGQPLLGEKYMTQKRKRKKNNPKNSGHFVPQQHPRAVHALRSDRKMFTLILNSHASNYLEPYTRLAYIHNKFLTFYLIFAQTYAIWGPHLH